MTKVATIVTTSDGSHSMRSIRYGVDYHSVHGAIQESEHVFLQSALIPLAERQQSIRILEMGFGSGLNALLTRLYAKKQNLSIYYETIEAFPVEPEQAIRLNFPALLETSPDDFLALHTSPWDTPVVLDPHFTICKWKTTVQDAPLSNAFDLVFFDAFAPNTQPELWEEDVLQKMYSALRPGGVLVTYCAKGVVKRTLRSIGFEVEGIPGPPRKREMIRANVPIS